MVPPADPRRDQLALAIQKIVDQTPILDIHTHLYDPAFGPLLLWGIDDLLVYHYLVAEAFRYLDLPYDAFWRLTKEQQADRVWQVLFTQRSPLSEAARGVITTLHRLGLDPRQRDLPALRRWFADWKPEDYVTRCLDLARVRAVCMTNSPFDDLERPTWERGFNRDPRFLTALRIDPLLVGWPDASRQLATAGYLTSSDLTQASFDGSQRFLHDWSQRIGARYVMVSLPPSFAYPDPSVTSQLIEKVVLPFCRESGLPFALMLGVKRAVNPALALAGDGVGRSDLTALQNLCAAHPDVRFLATVLSRENQQELCVIARKFRNLHVFGCWWFTNIPGIIEDMTRTRLELLGLGFTPQHSDARVLDQVIYKWDHSRRIVAKVLTEKYLDLADAGWWPTHQEIQRDVLALFGGAFETFCGPSR
ncbi:MAG: glucuronate isomerase [Verrucomicrobiales bacterium]|nr:glucuronate isomerase [Verrucomicrobiales bacterium]